MADFYWYDRLPELLKAEKAAMKQFFPEFKLQTLTDGRLYWVGTLNPRGKDGGVWTLMAIYNHDHPSNKSLFGSSVRIYSIKPDLNELYRAAGRLPHVLRDERGYLYMCTARQSDVDEGTRYGSMEFEATSAAKSLGWAAKWIWLVEGWLIGELNETDVFGHAY